MLFKYLVTTGMPMYQNYPERAKAKMTAGPMGRSSLRTDSIKWDDLDALRMSSVAHVGALLAA